MGFKQIAKKIVGPERLSAAKGVVMHYVCTARLGKKGKLRFENDRLYPIEELRSRDYHVFRGYYDLNYLSSDQKKLLVHRLPVNAETNRETSIEIGYVDLENRRFKKTARSLAWCWQQGSRLRWHPLKDSEIIFNDVDKKSGSYCARIVDVNSRKTVGKIDYPLYDIACDFSYGLSVNFERLQGFRPGYGYNYFSDGKDGVTAPAEDGLIYVDLKENKSKLLYSLRELADVGQVDKEWYCYLNHISISPDCSHFIFFLITCKQGSKDWNTILFVSDQDGKDLKILEREDRVSHYCWIDNDRVMITCHKDDDDEYYCIYNINDTKKTILSIGKLSMDGHPSPYRTNEFITDTYPRDNSLQRLRFFSLDSKEAETALAVYHDYRMRGEKRCDLHPSVESDGKMISIDTTFKAGKRSVLLLGVKE